MKFFLICLKRQALKTDISFLFIVLYAWILQIFGILCKDKNSEMRFLYYW